MTDPQSQTQPLIGAPSQETALNAAATPAVGSSSSRAYKIAGFTLLACLLVAGQALTAYFVLSQRSDIKSLEEQSNSLKSELNKGRAGSFSPVAVPMQVPMAVKLIDGTTEEGFSKDAPSDGSGKSSKCLLDAAALRPVWRCWCVDTTTGQMIPGTLTEGPARCGTASDGGLNRAMVMPDALHNSDD